MTAERLIRHAWMRSSGRCECLRTSHRHDQHRCGAPLFWAHRGNGGVLGGWEALAHPAVPGRPITDCEILCWECYKAVTTLVEVFDGQPLGVRRAS